MTPSGERSYLHTFVTGLRPDEPLWVEEWADAHMVIPRESGASEPGPYRVARTPFAREVMHALSPEHPARFVVVMGASQMMKTQVLLNWVSALIDGAPSNIIILEPDDNLARRVAKRFDKTVDAIPVLRKKVARRQDRDSKNTGTTKEFKGGTIWFLSGRSTASLAEASARYVAADEVDRILREQKGEGDTLGLLFKRQSTYGKKAKTFLISSPTEEDNSKINEFYAQGNQGKYYVPCPHCGEMQTLEWESIQYAPDLTRAWMVCTANGCLIEEHHKTTMLTTGEWRTHHQGDGETWSYQIGFQYAPLGWDSWLVLAREYEAADADLKKGDTDKMQVFYNTRLARVWSSTVSRIQPEAVQRKAQAYPLGIAPPKTSILTAAADVQGNRIELQIVGWGSGPSGLEPWIVNTHIFYGDPTLPEVWRELDAVLTLPVKHATGAELIISAVAIDSGDGDSTTEVYEFVANRRRRYVHGHLQYVMAIRGASRPNKPIMATTPGKSEYTYKGKASKNAAEIWSVGTDTAKDWLMNRLVLEGEPVIHTSTDLPLEFYQQLVSEAKKTERIKGKKRTFWTTIKKNLRNEQWDMLVYNLAMAHYLGLNKYTEKKWQQVRDKLLQADLINQLDSEETQAPAQPIAPAAITPLAPPPTPKVQTKMPPPGRKPVRGNWVSNW